MRLRILIFIALGLASVTGLGWIYQRRETTELKLAITRQLHANQELAHLRQEREKLAAAQTTEAELAALRADHSAVVQVRKEIAELERRANVTGSANSTAESK